MRRSITVKAHPALANLLVATHDHERVVLLLDVIDDVADSPNGPSPVDIWTEGLPLQRQRRLQGVDNRLREVPCISTLPTPRKISVASLKPRMSSVSNFVLFAR